MSGFGFIKTYKTDIHLPSIKLQETVASPEKLLCPSLYLFANTKHLRVGGLKPQWLIVSQFWRPEV